MYNGINIICRDSVIMILTSFKDINFLEKFDEAIRYIKLGNDFRW